MNPNYNDSLYSDEFKFILHEEIETPKNLEVTDETLEWPLVTDVKSYVVSINDEEYSSETNSYDLSQLDKNQFYLIKVKAIYRNSESPYSKTLIYHTYEIYKVINDISFNKVSEDDLTIDLQEELTIEKMQYLENEVNSFTINEKILNIKSSTFDNCEYGENIILAYTNKGIVEIKINVYDSRNPYLISSDSVKYIEGKSLEFVFELYSGELGKLTSYDITENDYFITGNKLIIKHEFLTTTFNEKNKDLLIFGYYITYNNNNVLIGYLFINR